MTTLKRQLRIRPPAVRCDDQDPPTPLTLQIQHLRRRGAPTARAAALAELVFAGAAR